MIHRALRIVFLCLLFFVFAAGSEGVSGQASASLDARLRKTLEPSRLGKSALVGAVVVDLKGGKTLFSLNPAQALIPASGQKLLTTAAAFCELGKDYKLTTTLSRRGELRRGELDGDLLLVGRGDPNLSGRFHDGDITFALRALAERLRAAGVENVKGSLYYDESFFSGERVHPDWPKDQSLRWYSAEVSALTLNDNCVTLVVEPTNEKEASVKLLPQSTYYTLAGSVNCIGGQSDPKIGLTRPDHANAFKVWGSIARGRGGYSTDCTVADPSAFCARAMLESLAEAGILVHGGVQRAPDGIAAERGWSTVAEHHSGLPSTIHVCNSRSQNLYAECLFRIVGKEKAGDGSFAGGASAVRSFLANRAKVNTQGLVIADGSGLARANRVSPRTLAELLVFMAGHADFPLFKSSLAVAGGEGTLERRLRSTAVKGRVFAKTGTLRAAYSLSGYLDAADGSRYAFSVIVNGAWGANKAIDDFVEALAK